MEENKKSVPVYVEPDDYYPKSVRKKYKLGEYAENEKENTKDGKDAEDKSS